jgi:predicted component of type VI protein secretion system
MSLALKIVDQTPGVHPPAIRQLRLASERTTLRELIARRIEEEVAALNAGSDAMRPLVVPTQREESLNGRSRKMIDAGRQLAAAIEAFERTRILVVVNEQQVLDLDQPLIVTPDTEVRFIKLVPLVGG